jgi:NAD(P)-dependent dehydrogenase (short-subunit alcohol dehydrogenase family)
MRALSEQTILVTGATSGHGRVLAGKLASEGATVLLHGRDEARGQQTIEDLRAATGNDKLRWYCADFGSLDEVRTLAERVTDEQDRLDVLVNNAGVGTASNGSRQRELSRDGYELRFAVNYLAAYLLSRLLIPLLERSAPARIVNVASAGQAPLDFADPMLEHAYDGTRAYAQSKLAQISLTFDLANELEGRGVSVNSLHPATYMDTAMVRQAGISPATSTEQGAEATFRLVAAPELAGVTGRYFDGTREATPQQQARDPDARRQLRELSEKLVAAHPTSERRS